MTHTNRTVCATDAFLFLAGAGLGVGLGVLLAPKSGAETRGAIRDKVGEGKEYVTRQGRDLSNKATNLAEKGKETIEKHRSSVAAAVDAGRQAYRETVSEMA